MEILGKILGSSARVKVMRAFMLNPKSSWSGPDLAKQCRISPDMARKEIRLLSTAGFVKKKAKGYFFNPAFRYADELENLLINTDTVDRGALLDSFRKTGRLKLLIVSGVFIKNRDARVDILIVGDSIKKNKIEEEIRRLESEIGTELTYAVFSTKEFLYRLSMFDKLVRDILDFPHEVLFEAKELSTQGPKEE